MIKPNFLVALTITGIAVIMGAIVAQASFSTATMTSQQTSEQSDGDGETNDDNVKDEPATGDGDGETNDDNPTKTND